MKLYLHSFLICCCLLYGPFLPAQDNEPEIRLARKLDSLSTTNRLSRHFARLYTETVLLSLQHYQSAGSRERDYLRRFETAFADLFFRADATLGNGAGAEAWTNYYRDTSLSPLHYQLLGINAHINADLSEALINGFSLEELRIFRKDFLRFQRGLRQQFHWFFEDNISTNRTTRIIGQFPLGLTRNWGSSMMKRWRKRQYRIAVTHYTAPEKSAKLRRKTARAKERTDRLILRYL
jgi:hypothetical protein